MGLKLHRSDMRNKGSGHQELTALYLIYFADDSIVRIY